MTVARARLTPPDDGRFSLASVGLVDWKLDKIEPVGQIGDLIDPTAGGHDVLVYVHGYNTTFETAALDAARLSDGIKFVGDTMVFSWPSRASLLDYGYDRESAMWSRDALQQVLDGLIANPVVGHIHIVAHSIGTMLTMEALRQLYAQLGGEAANRDRRGGVRFARHRHGRLLLFGPADRPAGAKDHRGDRDQRPCARGVAVDRWRHHPGRRSREGAARADGHGVIDASSRGGIINHEPFLSNAQFRKVIRDALDGHPGASASADRCVIPGRALRGRRTRTDLFRLRRTSFFPADG